MFSWQILCFNMLLVVWQDKSPHPAAAFFSQKDVFLRNSPLTSCRQNNLKWPYFVLIARVVMVSHPLVE